MDEASGQVAADEQIAEALAAGHESLSLECRADAARLERLLWRCIAPANGRYSITKALSRPADRRTRASLVP
jgi:hypothetical protein